MAHARSGWRSHKERRGGGRKGCLEGGLQEGEGEAEKRTMFTGGERTSERGKSFLNRKGRSVSDELFPREEGERGACLFEKRGGDPYQGGFRGV